MLVKIAFNIIVELRENAKGMRSHMGKKTPKIPVRFALETMCVRLMNALIRLGLALKFHIDNLHLLKLFNVIV